MRHIYYKDQLRQVPILVLLSRLLCMYILYNSQGSYLSIPVVVTGNKVLECVPTITVYIRFLLLKNFPNDI